MALSHAHQLDELEHYLDAHAEHLHYAQRLAEGRVIGSGQVEGACKHWIGRRLKQTGDRWPIDRANRMAGLCALKYSSQWNGYLVHRRLTAKIRQCAHRYAGSCG